MTIQSIEQQRAAQAMTAVQPHCSEKIQSEYLATSKAFAANVQQNGLGQTLAMYQASSTQGPKWFYQDLTNWFAKKFAKQEVTKPEGKNSKDLLEYLVNTDQQDYLRIQNELLAYARWLKKFSVAMLSKEEPSESKKTN